MVVITCLGFVLVAIITKAYKNWEKYYPTMLYVSAINLFYNFVCKERLTWQFHPDILSSHKATDIVDTLILLPCATLLYLSFLPRNKFKHFLYYLGWIAMFSTLEYIWYIHHRITYHHGWTLGWSILFYFAMFYVIDVHNRNIKRALIFSAIFAGFLLYVFKIPLW